jgi:hypothetical protein
MFLEKNLGKQGLTEKLVEKLVFAWRIRFICRQFKKIPSRL